MYYDQNEKTFSAESLDYLISDIETETDFILELQVTLNVKPAKLDKKKLIKTLSLNLEKNLLSFDDFELQSVLKSKNLVSNICFNTEIELSELKEENSNLKNKFNMLLKELDDLKEDENNNLSKKGCPLKKYCNGKGNLNTGGEWHKSIESCPLLISLKDLPKNVEKNACEQRESLLEEIKRHKKLNETNEQEILRLNNKIIFQNEPSHELNELRNKYDIT
ncbi:unnamed protein product, partial [Brachionus calyciflorus]